MLRECSESVSRSLLLPDDLSLRLLPYRDRLPWLANLPSFSAIYTKHTYFIHLCKINFGRPKLLWVVHLRQSTWPMQSQLSCACVPASVHFHSFFVQARFSGPSHVGYGTLYPLCPQSTQIEALVREGASGFVSGSSQEEGEEKQPKQYV